MKGATLRFHLYQQVLFQLEELLAQPRNLAFSEQIFCGEAQDLLADLELIQPHCTLEGAEELRRCVASGHPWQAPVPDILRDLRRSFCEQVEPQVLIDFIVLRRTHWRVCELLARALMEEPGVQVRIVPVACLHEWQDEGGRAMQREVERSGLPYLPFEAYDIEKERPDIVVDNMAVDSAKEREFRALRIGNFTGRVVHLEHSVLTGYTEAMKAAYFRVGRSRCWQYLVPSELFSCAFPLIFRIDGNYLAAGTPEADIICQSQQQKTPPRQRKQVLWDLDTLEPNRDVPEDHARLARELDTIEQMARRHPEVRNIVRPHPDFYNNQRCAPFAARFEQILSRYPDTVVRDTNIQIYDTYREVDAMMTWMTSTTAFSFGVTGKPFMVMPGYVPGGYDTIMDMHLLHALRVAYAPEDVDRFFTQVSQGLDEGREERLRVLREYFGPLDGTASRTAARKILQAYYAAVQEEKQ